jgi:hypothetical protein
MRAAPSSAREAGSGTPVVMIIAEGTVIVSVQPIAEVVLVCVQDSDRDAVVEVRVPLLSVKVPVNAVEMLPGGVPPGAGVVVRMTAVSSLKLYVNVPAVRVTGVVSIVGTPGSGIVSVGGLVSVIVAPVAGAALPLPPALTVDVEVRNVLDEVVLMMHPAVFVVHPVLVFTLTPCPKLNVPIAGAAWAGCVAAAPSRDAASPAAPIRLSPNFLMLSPAIEGCQVPHNAVIETSKSRAIARDGLFVNVLRFKPRGLRRQA